MMLDSHVRKYDVFMAKNREYRSRKQLYDERPLKR